MMILGKSRGVAAILAAALALAAAPASAQQPPAKPAAPAAQPAAKPDAKALFASGEKKFKAGDYAAALTDFEASQAAKEDPATQRYIAVCLDNLQRYQDAAAAYDKFLAAVPVKMKTEGEDAKRRVEAIRTMPGHVHVTSAPDGAIVALDGQLPTDKKTPADLDLPPGKHAVTLTLDGYETATKEVDVAYASKQDVNVELQKKEPPPPPPPVAVEVPPPQPPPPPPPPPEPRSKVPAYVTGAVAIVAAGVGTGFGIKALKQSNDFKDHPTTQRADDGENNALVADMMFGIAITFGVTSAVLFLSSDTPATAKNDGSKTAEAQKPKKKTVTVTPAPYVTPHGGGAGALVQF